jgi:hypothetical protein
MVCTWEKINDKKDARGIGNKDEGNYLEASPSTLSCTYVHM